MGWGRGLLSVYQSLVWLGCARIKKLFVGHIRGNKRLRCQYDLMNYFYSCHSHTLSTLFFFLVQFIMEPLKISTLYIFGCLECIIIIIITTVYPLPRTVCISVPRQRKDLLFIDKRPVSAWKKLSKFRLEWKNLIADRPD